jgi:PKD repeat protein
MNRQGLPASVLRLTFLAITIAACRSDVPTVTEPATVVGTPAQSAGAVATHGSLASVQSSGVPYGPAQLWRSDGTIKWGPEPFTASLGLIQASSILQQIDAARLMQQKLMLNMTGGSHERYKTDGKFDIEKWKAVMHSYDSEPIKAAVDAAVEDGTIVMNSVMDEPQVVDWGGVMTKPLLDEMATYVKNIFPTLPTGVVARWDWRPEEQYQVIDFIMAQYMWQKGDVTTYRDNVLAQAAREGLAVVFSLNILDGGIKDWQTRDCPIPLTGGFGTKAPNCSMTADQVRDWGRLLGVAGCAMSMWQYDAAFMANPDNQQAFTDVAATLAAVPNPPPCTRGAGAPPPPPAPDNAAPQAAFDAPRCVAGLPCHFKDASQDRDGQVVGWQWDFGDESTSAEPDPVHTYLEPGSYDVTLEATDDDGAQGFTSNSVVAREVNVLPQAAYNPPECTAGVACQFLDGSSDSDGSIVKWSWDFGDESTSAEQNPQHTFQASGTFSVTLLVTDNDDGTQQVTSDIVVAQGNRPPEAAFQPPSCTAGVPCSFSDASTDEDGQIASRSWDFGSGDVSTENSPSHTFTAAGSYPVTLSVVDDDGAGDSISATVIVSPRPPVAPTAGFSFSCSALSCAFTDRSIDPDRQITARTWSFGDGTSSTAINPSHTYAAAKTYTVTLRVSYGSLQSQSAQAITVSAPKTAITLTVTGRTDATKQYMTLRWSGAKGSYVSVYRDGRLWLLKTLNDGFWVNSRALPGAPSYTYKVCQVGTTICSNLATVRFR